MKRHIYLNMKSVEEAREIFLSRFDLDHYLPPEEIPTIAALGRITATPVFARLSSPHYHSAAMDGYAVAAETTFGASQDKPRVLELGSQAFPVNTGNPLPKGTDAVIMVENVQPLNETQIQIEAAAHPWQHIRKVGEDLVAHEMVLPEKTEITPYALGALLAAGVTRLLVRRRPRVVIIPTGDELISVEEIDNDEVPAGRIIEFNSVMLAALVEQLGGLPEIHPIVADRRQEIQAALVKALGQGDMVIINAGSSAGSEDYTAQVIAELGEVLVHGVTMMPGKPTILGVVQGKPVMGNPGYPVSAALSFEQFAAPTFGRAAGTPPAAPAGDRRPAGPEDSLQSGPGRIYPGDAGEGGAPYHRHTPAPGGGDHHFPGAGRRPHPHSGQERRSGGGKTGAHRTAAFGRTTMADPGGDRQPR